MSGRSTSHLPSQRDHSSEGPRVLISARVHSNLRARLERKLASSKRWRNISELVEMALIDFLK